MVGNVGNGRKTPLTVLGVQPKTKNTESSEEQNESVPLMDAALTGERLVEKFGMTGKEIRDMLLREDKNYADFEYRIREKKYPLATRFSSGIYARSDEMCEMEANFRADWKSAAFDFIDGKITADEVIDRFEEIVDKVFAEYQARYYLGDYNDEKTALLSNLYMDFRYDANYAAVARNREEGRQYVEYNPSTDIYYSRERYCDRYVYYNAEYYYKAKEITDALERRIGEIAERKGIEDYAPPTDLPNSYRNFNTALFNGSDPNMMDATKEPPRDFRFFFQERPPVGYVSDMAVLDENGNVIKKYPDTFVKDPSMEYCGIVKAWGKGWHDTARIPFKGDLSDFRLLSTIFTGKNVPPELRGCLANFRIYSDSARSMNYWADKYGTGTGVAGRVLGYA